MDTKVIITKTKKGRPKIDDGDDVVTMSVSVTKREMAEFKAMADVIDGGNASKLFRRVWESWKKEMEKTFETRK